MKDSGTEATNIENAEMEDKDIEGTDKEDTGVQPDVHKVGPEILNGFNFEKRDRDKKKSSQPGQGGLILLIINGVFLIAVGSYLLSGLSAGSVTGADLVQAVIIIAVIIIAGALMTVISSIRLAKGRFRGGSHENG